MRKHSTFNIQRPTFKVNASGKCFWRIPKGFRLSAQPRKLSGLGNRSQNVFNPNGVDDVMATTQGSSFLATLGYMIQSRWDWGTKMIVMVRLVIVMAVVVVGSQNNFAQSTNAPARLSYDSFRTISDRNIFNPNRYARGSGRTNTRASSTPASRVESFSLVGIMAYEKGWFAFFDGTKSDYKHALQTEGVIGDYKVMLVTPDAVKIAAGTNSFDLKVGMQMRREDEGDWFLSEGGETARKRIISTRTRTRSGSHGESSTSGGEEIVGGGEPEVIVVESEPSTREPSQENGEAAVQPQPEADSGGVTDPVLLRLMQRRQQMNQ